MNKAHHIENRDSEIGLIFSSARGERLIIGNLLIYQLFILLLVLAVLTQNAYIMSAMACLAYLPIILPNHPFFILYNIAISKKSDTPKVYSNKLQMKLSSATAAIWLSIIAHLYLNEQWLEGNEMVSFLIAGVIPMSLLNIYLVERSSKNYNS